MTNPNKKDLAEQQKNLWRLGIHLCIVSPPIMLMCLWTFYQMFFIHNKTFLAMIVVGLTGFFVFLVYKIIKELQELKKH